MEWILRKRFKQWLCSDPAKSRTLWGGKLSGSLASALPPCLKLPASAAVRKVCRRGLSMERPTFHEAYTLKYTRSKLGWEGGFPGFALPGFPKTLLPGPKPWGRPLKASISASVPLRLICSMLRSMAL